MPPYLVFSMAITAVSVATPPAIPPSKPARMRFAAQADGSVVQTMESKQGTGWRLDFRGDYRARSPSSPALPITLKNE